MIIEQEWSLQVGEVGDLVAVAELLAENGLPFTDLIQSKVELIVAREHGALVGCAGIQRFGSHAILRSVAVKKSIQKKGIGSALFIHLLSVARSSGIKQVHLLTETAQTYWALKGFVLADRGQAPESIRSSAEFSNLCPSSAAYMVLDIEH